MPKWRKKPVVVEAIKFDPGVWSGWKEDGWPDDMVSPLVKAVERDEDGFFIDTLEGRMEVAPGDFVIQGVEGEFYPCKPGIFYKTYERAP